MSFALGLSFVYAALAMAFFIAHFCVGVVLARIGLGPQFQAIDLMIYGTYVSGAMALISDVKGWIAARSVCFSLAGILWGVSHGGQTILRQSCEATVFMVGATSNARGPLLVKSEEGAVFETFGSQILGAHGSLKARDSESVFGSTRLTFYPISTPGFQTVTWWQRWQRTFLEWLQKSTRRLHAVDRVLTTGIVFGLQGSLPKKIEEAFKNTGLYHLLVVSGLHVSLMAAMFAAILRMPLLLGYSLRIVSPRVWRQVSASLRICAALGAMAYLSLTGASAAAQRSALFFAVRQVSLVFLGNIPFTPQLLATAMLQIFIFPLGFLSEGTCMSWAAYLVVARPPIKVQLDIRQAIVAMLSLQTELMVLVTAIFGQLILIGLVTNLLFVSVFPVILFTCLIAIISPWPALSDFALEFPHNYLRFVGLFDQLTKTWPMLSVPKDQLPPQIRSMFVVLSVWVILNAFKRLSIRQTGGARHG